MVRFFTLRGREIAPQPVESQGAESEGIDVVPPSAAHAAQEVARLERGERHLATFLNSSLSALGGLWVGAVPLAWISTGGPLGGVTGFVASSGLLFVALQAFFGRHPWLSHNAKLRRFGLEIIRRSDGARRYWVLDPDRMLEGERRAFEAQLELEREGRRAKALAASEGRDSAKRSRSSQSQLR